MDKQNICSELFYSMDLRLMRGSITNCCKTTDIMLDIKDFNNPNILCHNPELKSRKESMILHNKLPEPSCFTCTKSLPNSFFKNRNLFHSRLDESFKKSLLDDDYIERFTINLSSACDLKCVYCAPKDSSSWAKEIGIPTVGTSDEWFESAIKNFITYLKNKKYNPNVQYTFIISGGEPTYNPHSLWLIEQIIDIVPNKQLLLFLHTNFNTKEKVFNDYVNLFDKHKDIKCVFDVSVDSTRDRAEAIRHGLQWNRLMRNMNHILDADFKNIDIRIVNTLNVYSVPYFKDDIEFYLDTLGPKKMKEMFRHTITRFAFNYANEMGMTIIGMPKRFKEDQNDAIKFCEQHKLDYFIRYLSKIKNLIGTNIIDTTAWHYDMAFSYFKIKRPETDWDRLFPHMSIMIEELYAMFPKKAVRYVPDFKNLKRPINSYNKG